jgi:tRNA dimethylallyltransferase
VKILPYIGKNSKYDTVKAMKQKLLVILGATATGKSALAVELALEFDGEIISADSRQVYTGLDIGTGKVTTEEMRGVPHHLLDIISPQETFSASEWKRMAEEKIADIASRGKLPMICGGTGFYIDQIVRDISLPDVPPDPELRAKLERLEPSQLFEMLQEMDPERAGIIDPQNPVRLVRAIEIATALGKVPPAVPNESYDTLQIGLAVPDDELRARIHARLLARIDAGMIEEAEQLHAEGLSFERMRQLGLEYKNMSDYLEKKISKEQMLEGIETESWQYARRQKQWFKRDSNIRWFAPTEKEKIEEEVRKFLN